MKEKRLRSILFFSLLTLVMCSNVNVKAAEEQSIVIDVENFFSHLEEINFQEWTGDLYKPTNFSYAFFEAFKLFCCLPKKKRVRLLKNKIVLLNIDRCYRENAEELKNKIYHVVVTEESSQRVIKKVFNSLIEERKERQNLVTSAVEKIMCDNADGSMNMVQGSMNEEEPMKYFEKLTERYHPSVAREALILVRERNKNSNEAGKPGSNYSALLEELTSRIISRNY
ncbi:MAG TPA: hypothetical protein ENI08_03230 [Candidatus Dependentiae bacterium]|nr:hypothetical protein [Candidatus Dependentiae bacterium]